jgi:hypothetical protein
MANLYGDRKLKFPKNDRIQLVGSLGSTALRAKSTD